MFEPVRPFNYRVDFFCNTEDAPLDELSLMVEKVEIDYWNRKGRIYFRLFLDKPIDPIIVHIKDKGLSKITLDMFNPAGDVVDARQWDSPKILSWVLPLSYLSYKKITNTVMVFTF